MGSMIYQVCVLVATIILGVLGIELMFTVRAARKLTEEVTHTLQDLNTHLPNILEDAQTVTSLVRMTSERVGGTVNEAAATLEDLRKNPLRLVTEILGIGQKVMELWQGIRNRKS